MHLLGDAGGDKFIDIGSKKKERPSINKQCDLF
jgi:hypothetical protein